MVSFEPETILSVGFLKVTNTLLDTLIVDTILIGASYFISKKISAIPNLFQNAVESVIEIFYGLIESVAQNRVGLIFPYVMTFFLFILIANWTGLIPGVSAIGLFENKKFIPLIRSATSDLNMTLAFAIISSIATHRLSIKVVGFKDYLSRYLSINPLNLFIGILEIISEITKVISLSFRLFGNIFAGEVVLLTVSSIFVFIFPIPFILLEIIIGLVQALVFAMLTMVFMAILTTSHRNPKEVRTT